MPLIVTWYLALNFISPNPDSWTLPEVSTPPFCSLVRNHEMQESKEGPPFQSVSSLGPSSLCLGLRSHRPTHPCLRPGRRFGISDAPLFFFPFNILFLNFYFFFLLQLSLLSNNTIRPEIFCKLEELKLSIQVWNSLPRSVLSNL